MDPAVLNLDDLRRWRMCERRFWLHRQPAPAAVQLAQPIGDDLPEGPVSGAALRACFPAAQAIAAPDSPAGWARAVRRTLDCLDADHAPPEGWAVFGACLSSDERVQARIDVLSCGDRGLRIARVRYATVGNESDVDAVALWVHVAARCGLQVQSAALLLIDTDFVYPGHGCHAGLFRTVDLGPVLGTRPVGAWLAAMRRCARGPRPPATRGAHCTHDGGCEFLAPCRAEEEAAAAPSRAPPDPCAALEVVGRELAQQLREEGHADLHGVPLQRLADARHRRAARAVQRGAPVLEPSLAALARGWSAPRYSLRIDTIGFAVPVWAGTQPYQSLPFQWTCGVEGAGGRLETRAFLAGPQGDPRRAFAQSLLEALGTSGGAGPVFAYNAGFERNRLRDLARQFDDLAPALDALQARIVDLFQVARAHYYHPAMAGAWSFRSICRAVAPDIAVAWADTDLAPSAPAAFAQSLRRDADAATRARLRAALQAHGRRQTEALRRLVALFEGAAGRQDLD